MCVFLFCRIFGTYKPVRPDRAQKGGPAEPLAKTRLLETCLPEARLAEASLAEICLRENWLPRDRHPEDRFPQDGYGHWWTEKNSSSFRKYKEIQDESGFGVWEVSGAIFCKLKKYSKSFASHNYSYNYSRKLASTRQIGHFGIIKPPKKP